MSNQIISISNVRAFVDSKQVAWLNLEDVARGLGFTQIKSGVEYVRWETVNRYLIDLKFSQQVGKDGFIPENIFYRLAMKANNEVADKFQTFVADEVLPSIRKNKGYLLGQDQMTPEQVVANALVVAQKILEQKDKLIEELKPKAEYVDKILKNKGLVTITQIAKDYGMSGEAMNKLLHTIGIQYKQSKQWLLYWKYQDKGYVHSETIDIVRSDGRPDISLITKWTQKGRLFLYEALKANGVLPIIEQGD